MTMIRDLYYALWANLSEFCMIGRAAFVLAVLVVFMWLIVRPLLFRLLLLLLRIAGLLTKLICLIGGKILGITAGKSPDLYAARYNRMADLTGRWNEHLLSLSKRLASKHKFHLGWMLLFYIILIFLVSLPTLVKSWVSEEYIPYFSVASNLYQRIETPALEVAAAYSPLFSTESSIVVEESNLPEDAALDVTPDVAPDVWLSLSELGQNGSNVRAGPSTDNQVLDTVAGDMQVLYLDERNGRWIHIRTEDGTEGWIHDSLVTGVPAEPSE